MLALASFARTSNVNASLANFATNTSVGIKFSSVDGYASGLNNLISALTGVVGDVSNYTIDLSTRTSYWKSYTDASLTNIRTTYVRSTSTGSGLLWVGGVLTADVSVIAGGVTLVYVDGSFNDIRSKYIPSVSTGAGLYWTTGVLNVSIAGGTGDVTKAYVDGSLAARDASFATNASIALAGFAKITNVNTSCVCN
jgi:hypothetical protein